ncbi:DUF4340 domain-containing protein [Bdellovibrio svalbardensis]|uniref:DUF4340 domain-containing protein n=1 Tax=Bdellovibrio svalbardensis TaxID=2972972 RepID=A0ABT6DS29_9BACT|nr:DUF4340 domain-containing protein [Bdellovibrio svalbardensis]MDG0817968.1 DUF4340 domain-containing protein [Bdellovibrio svalbardensis]
MKLKGRSILVIALLLFGGYAVYDYFQDKKKEAKFLEESRLMTVNFDQVDTVEIEKAGQKLILKRSVDGWNVQEPLKDLADNTAVEDLIKNSATEKIIEIVKDENSVNWSMYGLDKPLGKITFSTTAGAKDSFEISEKRNFEENAYARRNNESRVLLVNSVWQNRIRKTVIDFRDRRVLRHNMASIDSLHLKNQAGLLDLSLQEGKWIVPAKKAVVLDQNKVRELLQGIADAKAAEFIEGAAPVLKPLFSLSLKLAEKDWKVDVGQSKDLKIYAKVSEPQFFLKLEPGAMDKLIKLTIEDLKETPPSKENNRVRDPLADQRAQLAEKKDKK